MREETVRLQQIYAEKLQAHAAKLCESMASMPAGASGEQIAPLTMGCHPHFRAEQAQDYFNRFFRDDLYGKYDRPDNLILSSGSLSQDAFPLCPSMRYAVEYSMSRDWFGYSDSVGRYSVRRAIAGWMSCRMGGAPLKAENIALTGGVTSALSTVLQTLKRVIQRDDMRILTHVPTYSPFLTSCRNTAEVDIVAFTEGFIDVEKLMAAATARTGIILVLGDLNPLGQMVPVDALQRLIQFCDARRIWLIFDEAGAVYPEYDLSHVVFGEYSILLGSDSKSLGLPGMKTGYLLASQAFIRAFYEDASASYGSPASVFYFLEELHARFLQFMCQGLATLEQTQADLFEADDELPLPFLQLLYDDFRGMVRAFHAEVERKRNWTVERLRQVDPTLIGQVLRPQTGVNLSLRIAQWDNSYRFFLRLLEEQRVSVFPILCSGMDSGCWVRISYAIPDEALKEGIERLIAFLQAHDTRGEIALDQEVRCVLSEHAGFDAYPWLDFYGHLGEVAHTMARMSPLLKQPLSRGMLQTGRRLAWLHDAGKVYGVLLAAMHRIITRQRLSDPGWSSFSDIELLGLRDQLELGRKFSMPELLQMFPVDEAYAALIDWGEGYSPRDDAVRGLLFARCGLQLPEFELLARETPRLTPESPDADRLLAMLDIADKCSDHLSVGALTVGDMTDALNRKEAYAVRRYEPTDQKERMAIEEEFERARQNLLVLLDSSPLPADHA